VYNVYVGSEITGRKKGEGKVTFKVERWSEERVCRKRDGLGGSKGVCMDRDAWRGVTDRIV